jgi:hypothetical protein
MLSILLRQKLGPEISSSTHVSKSPLFQMQKGCPPTVDLTNKDVFIDCPWPNLLPHLKWVLGCKGLNFSFRIVTDQQIKNVYVGNEQYKNKPKGSRDSEEVFNSLTDLMEGHDLVILRLGFIGYPNKAAAGALLEALMISEAAGSTVWVVHDENRPWFHSRDAEVEEYIRARFEEVEVEPIDPGEDYENPDDLDLGMSVVDSDELEEEFNQAEPDPDDDDIELLSRPKKNKNGGR